MTSEIRPKTVFHPRVILGLDSNQDWRAFTVDVDGHLVTASKAQFYIDEGYGYTTEFVYLDAAAGYRWWNRIVNPLGSGRLIRLLGAYVYVDAGAGTFSVWSVGTETAGAGIAIRNLIQGGGVDSIASLYNNDTGLSGTVSLLAYHFSYATWIPLYYQIAEGSFLRLVLINESGAVSHLHIYPVWIEI